MYILHSYVVTCSVISRNGAKRSLNCEIHRDDWPISCSKKLWCWTSHSRPPCSDNAAEGFYLPEYLSAGPSMISPSLLKLPGRPQTDFTCLVISVISHALKSCTQPAMVTDTAKRMIVAVADRSCNLTCSSQLGEMCCLTWKFPSIFCSSEYKGSKDLCKTPCQEPILYHRRRFFFPAL